MSPKRIKKIVDELNEFYPGGSDKPTTYSFIEILKADSRKQYWSSSPYIRFSSKQLKPEEVADFFGRLPQLRFDSKLESDERRASIHVLRLALLKYYGRR